MLSVDSRAIMIANLPPEKRQELIALIATFEHRPQNKNVNRVLKIVRQRFNAPAQHYIFAPRAL